MKMEPPPSPIITDDVAHQFFPFFKVYKDGRVERFMPSEKHPPCDDPSSSVRSKDVVISSEPVVSARVFMPRIPNNPEKKLPLVVYIHGGGFSIASAFHSGYHKYVSSLVAKANVIAVSVDYRLAPEHPIPACYDDSWAVLKWVASHANGDGPDPWLNCHADLGRVFFAGDSAGANISHNMTSRVGSTGLPGVRIVGVALVHPYFGGTEDDKMWLYMCPENGGLDDPRLKPAVEDLRKLDCERVLVFVAGKDHLRERGTCYVEALKGSGWKGTVEIVEHEEERHVFHLMKPESEKAVDLMNRLVSFINQAE
ncbi:2-hydroxyisoflavanone dehydratase-like [Rosa rugosa]|uniref:2-hydroxyisoflavanone dehydratase-like n=1 Tax=Rosa rugosa TaxID=74645 RepID=UPI002B414AC0|nr:2-hydroxyisoflavanone dehydratase-like [Rosa rugosa]